MRKNWIAEIRRRLMEVAGRPVETWRFAIGDYKLPNEIVVTSAATKNANALIAWLNKIAAHGGGSNDGEAVESALEAISAAGTFDAVMIAGDEPPNSRATVQAMRGRDALQAEDYSRRFAQANTPIHTFV